MHRLDRPAAALVDADVGARADAAAQRIAAAAPFNESRALAVDVTVGPFGADIVAAASDWAHARAYEQLGVGGLATMGANVVVVSARGGQVLLARRAATMTGGGLLHVSANEGILFEELPDGALTVDVCLRAVREECGIPADAVVDAAWTGVTVVPSGQVALCAAMRVDASGRQLLAWARTAADAWENTHTLVDGARLAMLLRSPELFTAAAPYAFAHAGFGPHPPARRPGAGAVTGQPRPGLVPVR